MRYENQTRVTEVQIMLRSIYSSLEFFVYSIQVLLSNETWNFGSGIWNFNSFENFQSHGQFAPRWGKYFQQNEKVIA